MSNLFSCDCLTIRRKGARDAREEKNQEKDDGFWLMWGISNEYIKQNIIMAVLRNANFRSVNICRLIKNQSCKKGQGEKLWFFLSSQLAHEVLSRRNIVHFIELH